MAAGNGCFIFARNGQIGGVMQERTVLSGMDLKAYLGRLGQNPKYTEEILKLIEDDLRFGLTKEKRRSTAAAGTITGRCVCIQGVCGTITAKKKKLQS